MADVDLLVEVAGEPVLLRKVATVKQGIQDWTPVWPQVAGWFYAMEAKQFATEGRGRWEPLEEGTMYDRLRRGYGGAHPILERTGRLVASLLGAEHHVRVETPTSIELGTALKVGKWNLGMLHQTGTKRMPARPVIGRELKAGGVVLWSEDSVSLRAIFARHVHAVVTGQ